MHIRTDPSVSPRVRRFLDEFARWSDPMSVERINRIARAVDQAGVDTDVPVEAVEAMIAFEQRYGGLWYPVLGSNGMQYGLDGEATVYQTTEGWAFFGVVDGDWTWSVEVLVDGRAGMTLADEPLRILNRSIEQRLKAHALFAAVRDWPHLTLRLTDERGTVPILTGGGLPPKVAEASGPADQWWFDGSCAVHLQLDNWWAGDHDTWDVRCLSRDLVALDRMEELLRGQIPSLLSAGQVWCSLCSRYSVPSEPCL